MNEQSFMNTVAAVSSSLLGVNKHLGAQFKLLFSQRVMAYALKEELHSSKSSLLALEYS